MIPCAKRSFPLIRHTPVSAAGRRRQNRVAISFTLLFSIFLSLVGSRPASAAALSDQPTLPERIIVTFAAVAPQGAAGLSLQSVAETLKIDIQPGTTPQEYRQLVEFWSSLPGVVAVEEDITAYEEDSVIILPNDPLINFSSSSSPVQYTHLWPLKKPPTNTDFYGINLPAAWAAANAPAAAPMVIAVVDTGRLPHPDMNNRWLDGFDFVSNASISCDGDGRDADAADACFKKHGLNVASVIGAETNNQFGMAGIYWNARILPLRALGKEGGSFSDVVDAMRWAAGISIPGLPDNPNPARIINLSLSGSATTCPVFIQQAINEVTARGAMVVAAAGNYNSDASSRTPANCQNVITVGASDHDGKRARAAFSNYGEVVDIYAPGLSVTAASLAEDLTPNFVYAAGTSFSTPIAAGLIALMLSIKPELTQAEIEGLLKSTALPFEPTTADCAEKSLCGNVVVNPQALILAIAQNSGQNTSNPPPKTEPSDQTQAGAQKVFLPMVVKFSP